VQSLLKVVRGTPRPRDKIEHLSGRLSVKIRACSRSYGDPLDSYVYIGSGLPSVTKDLDGFVSYVRKTRSREDLQRALMELGQKIVMDYEAFSVVGRKPVIPGSSVKGNVRSRLELSFLPKNGYIRSCMVRASKQPTRQPSPGMQGWRHFRIWSKTLSFAREEACDYSKGVGSVCLICDLFGTTGLQALISFSDFVGDNIDCESLSPLELPDGEKLKAAPPGSTFSGHIEFRNIKPAELGLLIYGMGLRDSREGRPVLLGKHKYRRLGIVLGVVKYVIDSLRLAEFSKPLEVRDVKIAPGSEVSDAILDKLVKSLIEIAQEEFKGELADIDEVEELERVETRA